MTVYSVVYELDGIKFRRLFHCAKKYIELTLRASVRADAKDKVKIISIEKAPEEVAEEYKNRL